MSSKETTPPLTSASTDSLPSSLGEERSNNQQDAGVKGETILPNPGPARPSHYLARGNGRFTPLIALDELPSNVRIINVPLSLTSDQVVALGGQLCGPATEASQQKFVIIGDFGIGTSRNDNALGIVNDSSLSPEAAGAANIPSTGAINARLARALEGSGPSTDPEKLKKSLLQLKTQKTVAANQRYNPTTPGVLGQKVYCTHWMRTGECDFTQQGCMFVHAMPDLDTLELLGFRSYPRWFREMPRQYQIQNATDFNEVGLDQYRHSRGISGSSNWHNQPGKYVPPRGPTGHNFQPYPQPWPSMMPGQPEAISYGSMDAWRNAPFDQHHLSTMPYRPGPPGSMPFDQSFHPLSTPNLQASQANFSGPAPLRHSIWSRDSSPNMGLVNRLHKPLSPQIVSMQPRFRNQGTVGSFNGSPRPSSLGGGRIDNNTAGLNQQLSNITFGTAGANPRAGSLFRVNPHIRGRELHRQIHSGSQEINVAPNSNPVHGHTAGPEQAMSGFDVHHSVGHPLAGAQPANIKTESDDDIEPKIVDA